MAMTARRKVCIGIAVFLIVIVFVLPFVLGMALRGTVEERLSKELNAPVKLGGLSVTVLTPGATLSDVTVGEAAPSAGGQPLAKIPSLRATVSWGTVFGGPTHVTGLSVDDAVIHIGVNEKGESTFTELLDKMPPSERTEDLPLDSFRVRNARLTIHVPKALIAGTSALEPEPVVATLGNLETEDIVLPPPGGAVKQERFATILVEDFKMVSPLKGEASSPSAAEAGEAIEEGLTMSRAEGKLMFPDSLDKPMRVEGAKLHGLKVRNVLRGPHDPETLVRLQVARALGLRAPTPVPGRQGMALGNGAFYVNDLLLEGSALEVAGPDGKDRPAWWRLADLKVDVSRLGLGPGTEAFTKEPGHVKVSSPTKSSEGDGTLGMEWTGLTGAWPKLTFQKTITVTGIAIPPLSSRMEEMQKIKANKGTLSFRGDGSTNEGRLDWNVYVTISADTELEGQGFMGSMKSSLADVATGKEMGPYKVKGTLANPDFSNFHNGGVAMMAVLGGAGRGFQNIGEALFQSGSEMLGSASDAIKSGMGKAGETIKKVPGLGGLFGGEEKEEEGK